MFSLSVTISVKRNKTNAIQLEMFDSILLIVFRMLSTRQHNVYVQGNIHTPHLHIYDAGQSPKVLTIGNVCQADFPRKNCFLH